MFFTNFVKGNLNTLINLPSTSTTLFRFDAVEMWFIQLPKRRRSCDIQAYKDYYVPWTRPGKILLSWRKSNKMVNTRFSLLSLLDRKRWYPAIPTGTNIIALMILGQPHWRIIPGCDKQPSLSDRTFGSIWFSTLFQSSLYLRTAVNSKWSFFSDCQQIGWKEKHARWLET